MGVLFVLTKLLMLLGKISSSQLDKSVVFWVSNWLTGQAQRVVVNDVALGRQPAI